jgi:hypothetical protein
MQRAAWDGTAEAKGTRLIGHKTQAGRLARICMYFQIVAIQINAVDDILRNQFDRHLITWIDPDYGRRIGELAGLDLEKAFSRGGCGSGQRRQGQRQ